MWFCFANGDGCLPLSILFKYESRVVHVCSEVPPGTTGCSGECCFSVMCVQWYDVCNFVVFSVS